jgi:hypothetical protein
VSLRGRIRKAERTARGEEIAIPQRDGTVARFPESAGKEAYVNWLDRLGAGEDAPPEHPLLGAVRNTTDPEWQNSVYMIEDPDEHTRPIPDLSEPW